MSRPTSATGCVCWCGELNAGGQGEYQAIIFTRTDSPVQSIEDIRGRSFAFGSRTSTQGHLIPRLMLAEAGIELADLKAFEYIGSHADCANAVISGRYEAGGMQDT
ncbi:MAG TPA: phosphate/phosphite/phosphonate ABC transporter substrate-binding protein, partial [Anaerolineae bacterium]|nr:phosphate/phosphite/phosphonate ABC transporter substrate-binding protein [Anaerolineae bacterium]